MKVKYWVPILFIFSVTGCFTYKIHNSAAYKTATKTTAVAIIAEAETT